MQVKKIRKKPSPAEARRQSGQQRALVPEDVQTGMVLSIDPGITYLGWAVSKISPIDEPFVAELVDYGTLFGKGNRTEIVVNLISQIDQIIAKHKVTVLGCEDYMYIKGKEKGIFQVPALIGVIKYHWYLHSSREAIIIHAAKWKGLICGKGNANKLEVREHMNGFLSEEVLVDIGNQFSQNKGHGEQDCIDAIAINLYLCHMIGKNRGEAGIKIM